MERLMMTEMERELTKIIESQAHQIAEQTELIKALEAKLSQLQESLDYLTKKMYAKSSEKTRPGQLSLFENDPNFTNQSQLRNKPTK